MYKLTFPNYKDLISTIYIIMLIVFYSSHEKNVLLAVL